MLIIVENFKSDIIVVIIRLLFVPTFYDSEEYQFPPDRLHISRCNLFPVSPSVISRRSIIDNQRVIIFVVTKRDPWLSGEIPSIRSHGVASQGEQAVPGAGECRIQRSQVEEVSENQRCLIATTKYVDNGISRRRIFSWNVRLAWETSLCPWTSTSKK